MHGWTSFIALLLLLVPLAGCIDAPTETADDVESTDEQPQATLVLAECTEHFAAAPIPAVLLEELIPEGFTLVGLDPAGATALLVIASWTCEQAHFDGLEPGGVRETVYALVVEPPDHLVNPDAEVHVVAFEGITSRADLIPLYDDWGLPRRYGEVTLETTIAPGETARLGHVVADAGSLTTNIYTTTSGSIIEKGPGLIRLFGATNGALTGIVDVTETAHNEQEGTSIFETEGHLLPGNGIGSHMWGDGFGFELIPVKGTDLDKESGG